MKSAADAAAFIRANTTPVRPPLVPEIALYTADQITPLWQATQDALDLAGVEPPFWAFAWAGGQAVARYVLDAPDTVKGKRVLDICAGSGLCGIAAAKAGAAHVSAADIDPLSLSAVALNAGASGVELEIRTDDLLARPPGPWDVVLAGDVCYERALADAVLPWLHEAARNGALVLLGDPGRSYLPTSGLERVIEYDVPTATELESTDVKHTVVWRVV